MVRVLHELASLDGGGVAKLLFDYYSNIEDKDRLRFDFLIYDFYENGIYEEPLRNMGCTIYKIPAFKKDKKASLRAMREVIKNGNYDVVHSHRCTRGIFALWYAKKYKVRRRFLHSHIAYEDIGLKDKTINKVLCLLNRYLATDLFACGRDAAQYMWGKRLLNAGKVHIMTNAIDTGRFSFDKTTREQKRRELGLRDEFVVGIVGRLNRQKNHPFILEVFADVLKEGNNAVLLMAGRGEDEKALKALCARLDLGERVRFLGIRDDIDKLSNAFDLYVMPSLYEGLPVSAIESQANGLHTLISENVTREVMLTELVEYLPLKKEIWVNRISEIIREAKIYDREPYGHIVAQAGYDIKTESKKMEEYYIYGKPEGSK